MDFVLLSSLLDLLLVEEAEGALQVRLSGRPGGSFVSLMHRVQDADRGCSSLGSREEEAEALVLNALDAEVVELLLELLAASAA